ncbi:hypothetical protein F8566_17190 [Actinomadura rudentiformis]|uniref:Uncharacterized protein n=2 Tax=Actinomadura rudentiformis TaxID=359158 RepID=A0A6H9YXA8_9ACTN|nr:hypothetical protein F8566_17190 [Actinomadura rudentiformis]
MDRTFNTRPSSDLQADKVVALGPPQDPMHAIIVEFQQVWDARKRDQLPRYAAALWLKLQRPVSLLVICPKAGVATRYAEPIHTKLPGYVCHPLVLGPAQIPVFTDPSEVAAHPELATLGIAVHDPDEKVVKAFAKGLENNKHAERYYEHAHDMATPQVKRLLEEIMKSSPWIVSTPFAKEHYGRGVEEGEVKGERRALLTVLNARGLEVSAAERERITSCSDVEQLQEWVRRAATVEATADVFT